MVLVKETTRRHQKYILLAVTKVSRLAITVTAASLGKNPPWKTIHVGHKTPITANKTWCLICAFTNLYFDSHPAGNCATLDSHLTQSATVIKSQTNKTPNLLRDCKTGDQNTPSQKRTLVFLWPYIRPGKKNITWLYDLWTNFVAGNWTSFNFISVGFLYIANQAVIVSEQYQKSLPINWAPAKILPEFLPES